MSRLGEGALGKTATMASPLTATSPPMRPIVAILVSLLFSFSLSISFLHQTSPPSWDSIDAFTYPSSAGKNVTVFVLDTGVRIDHVELEGRAFHGKSFLPALPLPSNASTNGTLNTTNNTDDNGHGTFIAGIIASRTYGVAKSARVVSVKVLDHTRSATLATIIDGLSWTLDQIRPGIDRVVINLSLDTVRSEVLNRWIVQAEEKGAVVVASAGNSIRPSMHGVVTHSGKHVDACTRSPASASNAIIVAASDPTDRPAPFTNLGPCVDLFAPGVAITSLSHLSLDGTRVDEGTSAAAAFVSGVAALIMGESETVLSPADVRKRLMEMATNGVMKGMEKVQAGTPNRLLFAGVGREDEGRKRIVSSSANHVRWASWIKATMLGWMVLWVCRV